MKDSLKFVNLILALFLVAFTIGYTFAWFATDNSERLDFQIETSGYFAEGDGSAGTPFILNSPVHVYNLAWLQAMGRLQNSSSGYYFELGDNINMGNTVVPPIGTAAYPFIGNFNGNGKTISNLTVSTNWDVLTYAPSTSVEFSNFVGMFGRTGIPPLSGATEKQAIIKNFVLNDPVVEVSGVGTYATDEAIPEDGATTTAAGLAVGYAYGNVANIAVYKGRLKVDRTSYTSVNSIIGALHSDVDGSDIGVTQGGGNEGNNVGYLLPRDIITIVPDNNSIAINNGYTLLTSQYGFDNYDATSRWTGTLSPNNTQSKYGLGIFAVAANDDNGIIFRSQQSVDKFNYYILNKGNKVATTTSQGQISYDTIVDGKNWGGLLTEIDGSSYKESTLTPTLRYTNLPTLITGNDLDVSVEDEYPIHTTMPNSNLAIYSNTLYFNITDAKQAYLFVVGHSGSGATTLQLNKVMDADTLKAKLQNKAANELAGSYDEATINNIIENIDSGDFYFKNDYDILTSDIVLNNTTVCYAESLPARSSRTNIGLRFNLHEFGTGLYALSSQTGKNSDIHYIKASGVSDGSSGSGGGTEVANAVTNVDFVNTLDMTFDVNADGFVNFVKLDTRVYFGTSSVVTLWFDRNSGTTIIVYYNGSTPTASNTAVATFTSTTATIEITKTEVTDTNTDV